MASPDSLAPARAAGRRVLASLLLLGLCVTPSNAAGSLKPAAMIDKFCNECHNAVDWAGGVAFDALDPQHVDPDVEVWEKTVRKLQGRLMPPPGHRQPDVAERRALVSFLESKLDDAAARRGPAPGRVSFHRLNRTEYAREVDALLGVRVDPEQLLPPDAESHGFDNIAEVLQVSPAFLEQYLGAARDISLMAVGERRPTPGQAVYTVPLKVNHNRYVTGLPLGTRGGLAVEHQFPADGRYTINLGISSKGGSLLRSYPNGWLEHRHRLVVFVDGKSVFEGELGGEDDLRAVDQQQTSAVTAIQSRFRNIQVNVTGGRHAVSAAFVERTHAESDDLLEPLIDGEGVDDMPIITGLELVGPFDGVPARQTESRRKIFTCYPEASADARACASSIVTRLATQAFRRPVSDAERDRLMRFYDDGTSAGGFEQGVQKAIMAILASTNFLYRASPAGDVEAHGPVRRLNDFELASRLSFFLWGQGPDETLLDLATRGRLHEPRQLEAQVRRLLADPRARALVTGFGAQWLRLKDIAAVDPDARLFPTFDEDLRRAFVTELELFLQSNFLANRPVPELLTARHTFLNERLARHYGITDVIGTDFRRTELRDARRWGLLGKGGLLLQTSYPNRTSPVLRGAWILETLVGAPPAAPPPGVETDLDSSVAGSASLTVRQRLELHREATSCKQCHGVIDPLGLALENFDAIGAWRDLDRDARQPIDAAGELTDGRPVNGPADLRATLLDDKAHFMTAFTEKLLTYALGRAVEPSDMPAVRHIVRKAAREDYRFAAVVQGVVASEAFQWQSTAAGPAPH